MHTPLQITYRGFVPTDAIESHVRARAAKLETFSDRIVRCHVTLETPHRHKRHGYHHHVRIDIALPGADLVVARDPANRRDNEDLYASIDAAFDDARRMLQSRVAARRDEQRHAAVHR
jgi:ribosomal subunit interface protein